MRRLILPTLLAASLTAQETEKRMATLACAGDTMLGSAYPEGALPPEDGAKVLSAVAPIFRSADFAFLNLEGVLYDGRKVRAMGSNSWRYLMPTRYARHLAEAGLDVISTANNHANDAEAEGLLSTDGVLKAAGLLPTGTPHSPEALTTLPNGLKVGWLAFAPHMGTLGFDEEDMAARVKELSTRCDLVVVSIHAGAEGVRARHVPRAKERYLGADRGNVYRFAHAAVDAGADLVVGHGPHVLRGMEIYRNRLIAYSLGNFATYGRFNLKGVSGLAGILEVTLEEDGAFRGGRFHATRQDKGSEAWAAGIAAVPDPDRGALAEVRTLSREDFPESPLAFGPEGQLEVGQAPGGPRVKVPSPKAPKKKSRRKGRK